MRTTTIHHGTCILDQAWDVEEVYIYQSCSCPVFWPRKVCAKCWKSAKKCKCQKENYESA